MAFRPGMIGTALAVGVVVSVCVPLTGSAQFGRGGPALYTPAEDARDLKAVLFNWTWHMGMLRGVSEQELATTLEYQGGGSIQIDGQTCTLSRYRVSSNYQLTGQRTQYECTLPNGQTRSNVEVVSGRYAWNEDRPGGGLIPGEGTATAAADTLDERLIRLWAGPQGAAKAALAGAGIDLLAQMRDPGSQLAGGTDRIGDTAVTWEAGTPVVSYPIPGVSGATARATLDERFMAERVVVTHGGDTYEFTYGDYDDWNNPLNKIEAYFAGTIVERKNGNLMRSLNTIETETGSVYVVMPVPPGVGPTEPAPLYASDANRARLQSDAPTPRLADGKPDLTGNWGSSGGMNWRYGNRRCAPTQLEGCSAMWNQTIDFEFEAPSRFGPNRPLYRPEHWDKVIELDMWTNKEDPVMTCQPLGIPRQGPPRRIFHTPGDITMLYSGGVDGGGGYTEVRVIPTDGRELDERQIIQTKYTGHSVGHWEGDTLVIESVGFTPRTWLARGGFFHSEDMRIVERYTRQGNEMLYEITVEDPEVLLEPWVMTPRLLSASLSPDSAVAGMERGTCEAYELDDIVTQIRH